MKKQSLSILHRFRKHLLEKEQIVLQDKIAEENEQKARLLQLYSRVQATHEAKARATTIEEIRALDEAAAYLHGRITMAKRALLIAGTTRENALERTLSVKQGRDQIGLIIEKGHQEDLRELDANERRRLDDLITARYATLMSGAV